MAVKTINTKPIIGIVGGICSGKSAVAAQFATLSCAVIDADILAKQLLDEPTIQSKIISLFGEDILGPEGKINRQKLAKIVFPKPSQQETPSRVPKGSTTQIPSTRAYGHYSSAGT